MRMIYSTKKRDDYKNNLYKNSNKTINYLILKNQLNSK